MERDVDNKEYLFIDNETTGLPPHGIVPGKRPGTTKKEQLPYETHVMQYPHIVSIAWKLNDREPFCAIINIGDVDIPQEAIDIHGITKEMSLASDLLFGQVVNLLLYDEEGPVKADFIIGHGIYFDTSIIKANVLREIELGRLPHDAFEKITEFLHKDKRIDTMRYGAKFMGGAWPKLHELYYALFNERFNAHCAKDDVEAVARCFWALREKGIIPDEVFNKKPCPSDQE